MRSPLVIVVAASAALALSRGDAQETPLQPPGASAQAAPADRPLARPQQAKRVPASEVSTQEPARASVQLPDELRARIAADAATRASVSASQVRIRTVESVTWNDGALGCPQPNAVYTQALEPGYQVFVEAGARTFDYRVAARAGYIQLCPTTFPF